MATSTSETRIIEVKVTSTGEASLKALQTQLDAVAKQYDRAAQSTTRMNKAQQDADKQARGNRTAYVGLGQQLQDATIQLQMGTNALTVFTQQGSQAAYMLQGMGGRVGAVASFMAGPWGAAIFAATAVLGPFIAGLFDAGEASKEAEKAAEEYARATEVLTDAQYSLRITLAETTEELINIRREMLTNELVELRTTLTALTSSAKRLAALREEADLRAQIAQEAQGSFAQSMNPDAAVGAIGAANIQASAAAAAAKAAEAKVKADIAAVKLQTAEVLNATGTLATANRKLADERTRAAEEAAREAKRLAEEQAREQERLDKLAAEWAEYIAALNAGGDAQYKLNQEAKKLNEALKDQTLTIDGVAAANRRLKEIEEERAKITRKLAEEESPYLKYLHDAEDLVAKNAEMSNSYIKLKDAAMSGIYSPEVSAEINKQADAILKKLNPALKEQNELINTMNMGGDKKASLQKERDKLQATIDNQGQEGVEILTPEGSATVLANLERIDMELAKLAMSPEQVELLNLAESTILAIGDAFASAIEGAKSLEDAFKEVAKTVVRELVKIIVKLLIIKALQAAFPGSSFVAGLTPAPTAKGGVFDHGIKKFGDGGVVGSPTLFGMRGGLGVMGEAGPEAVMPLQRGANGKLGVAGTAPKVVINNYAGVGVSTSMTSDGALAIELRAVESARKAVASDIRRGGNPVSRAMETTYGVGRGRQ